MRGSARSHLDLALFIVDALQHALGDIQLPVAAAELQPRLAQLLAELCQLLLGLVILHLEHLSTCACTRAIQVAALIGLTGCDMCMGLFKGFWSSGC